MYSPAFWYLFVVLLVFFALLRNHCYSFHRTRLSRGRMLLKRGTGSGERRAGNGERKSGNELSAETSTKIQNGGPKNEREKEEDKERNSCLG